MSMNSAAVVFFFRVRDSSSAFGLMLIIASCLLDTGVVGTDMSLELLAKKF